MVEDIRALINERTDRELQELVKIGISRNYLTSDARGDRDTMIDFLFDLDNETLHQIYLRWSRE